MHATYREACLARGMLADERLVWNEIMEEAVAEYMPYHIRDLFAARIVHGPSLQAQGVSLPAPTIGADGWPVVIFSEALSEEDGEDEEDEAAEGRGTSFKRLLAHDLPHDSAAPLQYATSRIATLVSDQEAVFSAIRDAIRPEGLRRRIFLTAPGGCGKTYMASMLLAYARGRGKVALAVASSGFAATLMPLGRTAHSRFKIPIDIHARSMCNFEAGSDTARLLKRTRLIVCTRPRWPTANASRR